MPNDIRIGLSNYQEEGSHLLNSIKSSLYPAIIALIVGNLNFDA